MKIKVPAKTVEACDICQRQVGGGLLSKCVVCGKEYCHICEAIMCGCIHQPKICEHCGANEKVKSVVQRFAKPILTLILKRDTAMRRSAHRTIS